MNIKIDEEKGEMVCPKCNGKRLVDYTHYSCVIKKACNKCLGTGKLDWIENIVGKSRPKYSYIKPSVIIKEVDLSSLVPSK